MHAADLLKAMVVVCEVSHPDNSPAKALALNTNKERERTKKMKCISVKAGWCASASAVSTDAPARLTSSHVSHMADIPRANLAVERFGASKHCRVNQKKKGNRNGQESIEGDYTARQEGPRG
jgi:hypothetical protein